MLAKALAKALATVLGNARAGGRPGRVAAAELVEQVERMREWRSLLFGDGCDD